jgi:hypothetical protein
MSSFPRGCKTASYTGDGGYYSAGNFYAQPNDTVTLTTGWCYGRGIITSHSVTYSTTIPDDLNPRLSLQENLVKNGAVLEVSISGNYESGVLNNTGVISIVGHVNNRGHHHFVNDASTEG